MDTTKTIDERAQLLIDASSQQQKYRWLVGSGPSGIPQQTEFPGGVTYPAQLPCTPNVTYTDGPEGVRFTDASTSFPAAIAQAATWDTALSQARGDAMGDEAFDNATPFILAPGVASGRTPLSGRTPEYLGEDGLLSGVLAGSIVNGIQDASDGKSAGATVKHFVANEQELDRNASSSNLDERTLRETYGLPYEVMLDESDPASIMCSYNQINGAYACENPILTTLLKDDYGFQNFVMSDFMAMHSTGPAITAGLDQELNNPTYLTPAKIDAALAAGELTQEAIDEAAFRVVRGYMVGGLFDNPAPTTPSSDSSSAEHKALAYEVAVEGSVLLKNDGNTLPLRTRRGQSIALIGATASSTVTNGISAKSVCSIPWRFNGGTTMNCADLVSPETAITERAAKNGVAVTWNSGADVAAAASAAAEADVVIVFGYQRTGEFADLTSLALEGGGDELISSVAAANKNTVVVLQTGSAVEMPWLSNVDAVLETWYAGEQMGPALASLLFGDEAPSGKLPMTFPASLADTPTAGIDERYPGVFSDGSTTRPTGSTELRQVNYTEGLATGYRWYLQEGIDPLFSFGHGLSYTTFQYSKLKVAPRSTGEVRSLEVSFVLKNTGRRTGTEVAQVYVDLPAATGEPAKRLIAWERVELRPGQSKTVRIELDSDALESQHTLQYWSVEDGAWRTARGTYTVSVGGSVDASLTGSFAVTRTHGHGHS
ncbi:MAG: glycosyl hydrolase [Cellulomonadaceae bacterium]|nr:glycosyl hydrolase [Cellulomonadaceae bacterium]